VRKRSPSEEILKEKLREKLILKEMGKTTALTASLSTTTLKKGVTPLE